MIVMVVIAVVGELEATLLARGPRFDDLLAAKCHQGASWF